MHSFRNTLSILCFPLASPLKPLSNRAPNPLLIPKMIGWNDKTIYGDKPLSSNIHVNWHVLVLQSHSYDSSGVPLHSTKYNF